MNYDMHEHLLAEHRAALLREAEQRRLAASVRQGRGVGRQVAGALAKLLLSSGTRLEQYAHCPQMARPAFARNSRELWR